MASWGRLILSCAAAAPAAISGCAATPSAPAGPPASPVPPVPAEPAPAEPAPGGETPPAAPAVAQAPAAGRGRPLLPDPARVVKARAIQGEVVRYGRGAAVQWRLAGAGELCTVERQPGEGCARWAISSRGKATEGAWWLSSEAPPPQESARTAPREWVNFVGGKDVVYAQRAGKTLVVDVVSDKGEPGAQITGPGGWSLIDMIEGKKGEPRLAVLAWDPRRIEVPEDAPMRPYLSLAAAQVKEAGQGLSLEEPVALGIRGGVFETARDIRVAAAARMKVMAGPFSVVKLLDDAREDAWALAWIEVVPPAKVGASGAARIELPKEGARHMCGSARASRFLSDRSIVKRVHVSRFAGSKAEGDVVLEAERVIDPNRASLPVEPVAEGIAVRGSVYDRAGKVVGKKAAPPAARTPEPPSFEVKDAGREVVVGAAFSEGEGAAVVESEGGEVWLARFGVRGEAVGEPVKIRVGGVPRERVHLMRSGGGWFALRRQGEGVVGVGVAPGVGLPPEREVIAADLKARDREAQPWCSRVVSTGEKTSVALCYEPVGGGAVGLRAVARPLP